MPAKSVNARGAETPTVLDVRVVTGTGGGPEKTILNSPRYLRAAGYRSMCAYMHPPDDPGFAELAARAERCAAPLVSIPDRGPFDWRVVRRLATFCRAERVAIWHGHDYKSNALGLFVRRIWPMRLVTTLHGWVTRTRRTPLYYRIDRWCLPRYDKVVCVSADLFDRARDCRVPADRCVLIENGVDCGQFARRIEIAEAKRRLGINPTRLVIGAVGRLSAEKGFDLLIRAADELIRSGFDAELFIAGDGPARESLEQLVRSCGRTDRVRLLGYRSDVPELFQAMDVFALSSLREGLPNVLLEAMAVGVPVVATRTAGVPRVVEHGRDGLLIEPGRVDELTGSLARLLSDAVLRARIARAARDTVVRAYDLESRMHKMRVVYDSLLGRPCCESSIHSFGLEPKACA